MPQSQKTSEELLIDPIKKYFPLFKEIYDSEQEMLNYAIGFQEVYQAADRAFYELFSLSEFVLVWKRIEDDFLKLIMITSIIEKLNSREIMLPFLNGFLRESNQIQCKMLKKNGVITPCFSVIAENLGVISKTILINKSKLNF